MKAPAGMNGLSTDGQQCRGIQMIVLLVLIRERREELDRELFWGACENVLRGAVDCIPDAY